MTKYARFRNAYALARRKNGGRWGSMRYALHIARHVGRTSG